MVWFGESYMKAHDGYNLGHRPGFCNKLTACFWWKTAFTSKTRGEITSWVSSSSLGHFLSSGFLIYILWICHILVFYFFTTAICNFVRLTWNDRAHENALSWVLKVIKASGKKILQKVLFKVGRGKLILNEQFICITIDYLVISCPPPHPLALLAPPWTWYKMLLSVGSGVRVHRSNNWVLSIYLPPPPPVLTSHPLTHRYQMLLKGGFWGKGS